MAVVAGQRQVNQVNGLVKTAALQELQHLWEAVARARKEQEGGAISRSIDGTYPLITAPVAIMHNRHSQLLLAGLLIGCAVPPALLSHLPTPCPLGIPHVRRLTSHMHLLRSLHSLTQALLQPPSHQPTQTAIPLPQPTCCSSATGCSSSTWLLVASSTAVPASSPAAGRRPVRPT